MEISIRPLVATDRPACRRLFEDTVHRVNCRDYTPEQIQAWAPRGAPSANWEQRFEGKEAWVACVSEGVVGFADLDADGYLDRLFVSADHQRQGIARRLLAQLVQNAKSRGVPSIRTEASITARPFFEAVGFRVLYCQEVLCRGVRLTSYRMELRLEDRDNWPSQ